MNRRSVFQFIASIPVIGWLLPNDVKSAEQSESVEVVQPLRKRLPEIATASSPAWMQLAEKLWENYELHLDEVEALGGPLPDQEELLLMKAVCFRMMAALHNKNFFGYESKVLDSVTIGVRAHRVHKVVKEGRDGSTYTFFYRPDGSNSNQLVLDARGGLSEPLLRRVRARWCPEVMQDLAAYHGIDAETELVASLGEQLALEIQAEIRSDHETGITHYLMDLPFFAGPPSYCEEAGGVRRKGYIKYVKGAA